MTAFYIENVTGIQEIYFVSAANPTRRRNSRRSKKTAANFQVRYPCGAMVQTLVAACLCVSVWVSAGSTLYPRDTETREVLPLDGVWRFALGGRLDDVDDGFQQRWYEQQLPQWQPMPVPASYNDVTTSAAVRDHVGWAWYQRDAFARGRWRQGGGRVYLRFGSVHYFACVWVNGQHAGNHTGGHLPFDLDVTALLAYDSPSLITVAVNNTLTNLTIPQGATLRFNDTNKYPPGYTVNDYTFDFFNYAGIHRSVFLHTVPDVFIDDITVNTHIAKNTGGVKYKVSYQISENEVDDQVTCNLTLLDDSGVVGNIVLCEGDILVKKPKLWWPVYMSESPAHLYTLQVELWHGGKRTDVYRLPVGIRTVTWNETSILLNDKPIYLYGFGKHEDSILRGKGLDNTLLVRDYNLIAWVGANSYRTSHYPYAEEALDMADRQGILIVAESPAVNLDNFSNELLERHKAVMTEMVNRDKNRPSVIMWSISNEARTQRQKAGPYYKSIVEHVKSLDQSRPIGFVTNQKIHTDQAAPFMDFIGLNRYFSWYSDTGELELIAYQVENEYTEWYNTFHKPIFISEYGADTVSGFHQLPAFVWTEDYQVALLQEHFKAFDNLRKKGFFVGEMIWNFADFATKQAVTRAQGNKKGIFTRERQPKHAAYILKARYQNLAKEQLKNMTETTVE